MSMARPSVTLYQGVFAQASECGAVVTRGGGVGVQDFRESVRTRVVGRRCAPIPHAGRGGEKQNVRGQDQHGQHGHFHLEALDLLTEILRGPTDHESGDENGNDGKHQHAVEMRRSRSATAGRTRSSSPSPSKRTTS
jgi:hypothetical protein